MISFESLFFALVSNSGAKVIIFCQMQTKNDIFFVFFPEIDKKAILRYNNASCRIAFSCRWISSLKRFPAKLRVWGLSS